MKKLVLAAALAGAASTAVAGGLGPTVGDGTVMPPDVVVTGTQGTSAGGIVVPLILLALIAAVAAN